MSEPVIPGAPAGVRLRPHLDQLTVYTPGASTGVPAGIPIVKLSSNEGAEGPTPAALAALSAEAPDLNRYPDAGELHAALAAAHGLAPDMVAASPGADMSIAYLASAPLPEPPPLPPAPEEGKPAAPLPPPQLSPREQLVQALLLSNELMFVD